MSKLFLKDVVLVFKSLARLPILDSRSYEAPAGTSLDNSLVNRGLPLSPFSFEGLTKVGLVSYLNELIMANDSAVSLMCAFRTKRLVCDLKFDVHCSFCYASFRPCLSYLKLV